MPRNLLLPALLSACALVVAAQEGKFLIPDSPIQLGGVPITSQYFDVAGRKAILMGGEGGGMEAWIYPFKVAQNLRLSFKRSDFPEPIPSELLARWITVRPESTSIVFCHDEFRVTLTAFVPLAEQAIILLLDVETTKPLTIAVSFVPELDPMWPASLGGQYSFWDEEKKAFVISESRRRHNMIIGSPVAARAFSTPAHRLSETPNSFEIDVAPEDAAGGYIPVVFAGGTMDRQTAFESYQRMLSEVPQLYSERVEHARRLREELLRIHTPDERFNLAFEWGKVSMDDGAVCNPDVGCGWIAGYGMSGRSERPGFAWFFGGDTFFNSFSVTGYGDFPSVRTALELIRRNQRGDGKIMHELSQGAGFINWFEDFPYGYYHLETSPYYIVSLWNYVSASGDLYFLRESWPSMLKAFRYARTTETDGDGLVENSKGGLGALEVGVLLKDLKTDIYVAGLWVESMRCMERAAKLLGEEAVVCEIEPLRAKAEESLGTLFFDEELGFHALALAEDGSAVSELTVWPATPMMFGLLPDDQAVATLGKLAGPEVATDWGMRMLTKESSVYDPVAYNNGAVWPVITGYVAMAQYEYGRPDAGLQLVRALSELTFEDSRGDIAELYSGDYHRPLEPAVPHQLFSTGGFLAPTVRGLLGLHPDALTRMFHFEPQLPVEWDRLSLENVPMGAEKVRFEFSRDGHICRYRFADGAEGWTLRFAPSFPIGTEIRSVKAGGQDVQFKLTDRRSVTVLECYLPLDGDVELELELGACDTIVIPPSGSLPGQPNQGLCYIDSWREGDKTFYVTAGRGGRDYRCYLWTPDGSVPVDVRVPAVAGREYPRVTIITSGGRVIGLK